MEKTISDWMLPLIVLFADATACKCASTLTKLRIPDPKIKVRNEKINMI